MQAPEGGDLGTQWTGQRPDGSRVANVGVAVAYTEAQGGAAKERVAGEGW